MSIKNWIGAIALSVCTFGVSTASAAILTNGGFEDATTPGLSNPDWDVFDAIPGWTKFDNTAGIEVQRGNIGGATAYEGLNKVELDSDGQTNTNSGMYQSVTLGPGSYAFSFQYLGRTNNAGTNGIGFEIDSGIVGSEFITGVRDDGWQLVTRLFALADETEITVKFWAGGIDDTLGGYLDAVQISAVPLPPSAYVFGAAMIGLGLMSRRRKKKQAA